MARIAFRNFTGGEVTPTLSARYDLQKFGTFLQCCENFIPNLHGDIERRPGTRYLATLDGPAVLLPFQFNTEPENNYALVFLDGRILVADGDGLMDGVSIESPYTLEEVYSLSYHQVADVMYLAHRNHALRKLTRSGSAPDYTWSLEEVALNRSLDAPSAPSVTFVRGNPDDDASLDYTLNYVVTAVDENGVESLPSPAGSAPGKYPTDWVVGNRVDLTWPSVEGAKEYNIYRESAGYYGFIGVADGGNVSGGTVSGLRVGALTGSLVGFAGSVTRTIVHADGNPDVEDSDVTTPLTVAADAAQNAFLADGRLFVFVTKTTNTVTWELTDPGTGGGDDPWVWEATTSTATERFWAMVTPGAPEAPAGTYTSWETGDVGNDAAAPRGDIGPYSVAPVYEGATTLCFTDQNFEPDTSTTPKEDWNPFADGNHPSAVTVHQQRLVLAGTRDNPASFYMSRTGDYENFRKSRPLQDDDPVEYMLASGSIDDIQWLASFGELLIGTSGAEYKATSSGAAITPSDVQISTESFWGSAGLRPMIIGNSVMHCQRSGSHVRDLYYSWENDGYAGNDLSLLAPQLVETHGIRQWAFQQSPGSHIWCVREDGVLLCLTYMQEQRVYAWSRHVTAGRVLSVASLCGTDEDVVMLVVERDGQYFLERMARHFRDSDGIEDAFFVDCGKTVRLAEKGTTVTGLDHLEGREVAVLADGSPEEGHVVQGGRIELYYPASVVHAGLNYSSVLSPMPVETDGDGGSTLGRRRAYGKVVLRLYRSVGGSYAASRTGDIFDTQSWQERDFYDLPFLPAAMGEAVQPFSGDMTLTLPAGQDEDTLIWIKQDRPQPFRLVAIAADIDFGEQ